MRCWNFCYSSRVACYQRSGGQVWMGCIEWEKPGSAFKYFNMPLQMLKDLRLWGKDHTTRQTPSTLSGLPLHSSIPCPPSSGRGFLPLLWTRLFPRPTTPSRGVLCITIIIPRGSASISCRWATSTCLRRLPQNSWRLWRRFCGPRVVRSVVSTTRWVYC